MSNPEAGETVLTPVKRNCNAGKVPIRFKFLMAASISGKKKCFFRVIIMFAIKEIVFPVENKRILPDLFE